MRRLTTEKFIERSIQIYGSKYDYSKVNFVNTSTKVCILCSEHGEYWITPNNLLNGHKCPACSGRQRITKEIFIQRSKIMHHNRYDYSQVNFKGLNKDVCIICPVHGEFKQKPKYHLNGNGCQSCFSTPKSCAEEFIKKAQSIYGERYDYSKVVYVGNKTKVCIICPDHGEWWMSPNNHLRGHRCPGCYGTPKHSRDEFIQASRKVHGNKFDYSKVEYLGNKKKVCIICPVHGEFWQTASSHLNGNGCSKCSGMEPITQVTFISRAMDIHKGKYDYTNVIYSGRQRKVCIICPEHGAYWQNPHYHLHGGNCPKCVGGIRLTTEEFIEKAKAVHEDRYDYSKVNYRTTSTKVCIICNEHGEFWQTPNNHLFGAGCPACPQSKLESEIRQLLIKNKIVFEQEKGFSWLVFNRSMFLDFFLPEYGLAIECQGGQHFFPSKLFGGEEQYQLTIERDKIKNIQCKEHDIQVLYYSNCHIKYPYPVFESMRLLLKAIKQHGMVESMLWEEQIEFPFINDRTRGF